MLTRRDRAFLAKCDVCGATEKIEAENFAEAWSMMKRLAWVVRRHAFPVIHVCPDCPAEAPQE